MTAARIDDYLKSRQSPVPADLGEIEAADLLIGEGLDLLAEFRCDIEESDVRVRVISLTATLAGASRR